VWPRLRRGRRSEYLSGSSNKSGGGPGGHGPPAAGAHQPAPTARAGRSTALTPSPAATGAQGALVAVGPARGGGETAVKVGREAAAARALAAATRPLAAAGGAVPAPGHDGIGASQSGADQGVGEVTVGNWLAASRTRGCEVEASPVRVAGARVGWWIQPLETRDRNAHRVPVDPGTAIVTDDRQGASQQEREHILGDSVISEVKHRKGRSEPGEIRGTCWMRLPPVQAK
jgi:hypothetical protein